MENNSQNPFENLDEQTKMEIQELQILEQSFQQLLMQKQAFSMELVETKNIVDAVEKSDGEISRIVGNQVIIKTTKEKIIEEMKNKKNLIEKRLKNIDEQEEQFSKKSEELREKILKKIQQ